MSVRHIGLVLDHLEAPAPVKLVALVLADHCDSDGFCWPSYRRLAERSCLSERSVRRHVAGLIAAGRRGQGAHGARDNEGRAAAPGHERLPPLRRGDRIAALPADVDRGGRRRPNGHA